MSELILFDCHAGFGPAKAKPPEARWTKRHLLDDMDLAGVAAALTTHSLSLLDDPMTANRDLIDRIGSDRDRLHPCWVALPALSGEFPDAGSFVDQMRRDGVRAVRIEPGRFGIPVRERIWAPLRDALAEEDALVVTAADPGDRCLEEAERLLTIFKGQNTLLVDHGWYQWRGVVCLMDRFPKLHIEFSTFQANRAMEYFADRFGADRCLFGTGLPHKAPGAARGFLDWSLLPREQVERIAGENLCRLLGTPGPAGPPEPSRWHDAITGAARRGEPLPCPTLDAHCHILADGVQTGGREYVMLRGDAEGMMQLNRRTGIDRTAVMSWTGPLCLDTARGNEIVADAVRRHPDHFIGLATVNPGHDSAEDIEAVIKSYLVDRNFPGLKTYSGAHGLRYDDELFDRWFGFGDAHRRYAVIDDVGRMDDREMERLATKFPHLEIHLDHCGRSWAYARWAVAQMKRYDNVVAQINYTNVTNGVIEHLVEQVGADRILFGTDAPMRDPRPQAAWLAFTRLSEQEKRKIYGGNFARTLERAGFRLDD